MSDFLVNSLHFKGIDFIHLAGYKHALHPNDMKLIRGE